MDNMDKLYKLMKIRQMSIAEKMARLAKADFDHVQNCIEQALQDEQNPDEKETEVNKTEKYS